MIVICQACRLPYWEEYPSCECGEVLRAYTDGRDIFDHPEPLLLFYCPACGNLSGIEEAQDQGRKSRISWLQWLFPRSATKPPPEKYIDAINIGLPDSTELESTFRLESWRSSNDPFRNLPDNRKPLPEDRPEWWRDNLCALRLLLDPSSDEDALCLAEIDRELGAYSECLDRVTFWLPLTVMPTTLRTIKLFAERKNPFVQEVK
jgi:hypothetical protein